MIYSMCLTLSWSRKEDFRFKPDGAITVKNSSSCGVGQRYQVLSLLLLNTHTKTSIHTSVHYTGVEEKCGLFEKYLKSSKLTKEMFVAFKHAYNRLVLTQ